MLLTSMHCLRSNNFVQPPSPCQPGSPWWAALHCSSNGGGAHGCGQLARFGVQVVGLTSLVVGDEDCGGNNEGERSPNGGERDWDPSGEASSLVHDGKEEGDGGGDENVHGANGEEHAQAGGEGRGPCGCCGANGEKRGWDLNEEANGSVQDRRQVGMRPHLDRHPSPEVESGGLAFRGGLLEFRKKQCRRSILGWLPQCAD